MMRMYPYTGERVKRISELPIAFKRDFNKSLGNWYKAGMPRSVDVWKDDTPVEDKEQMIRMLDTLEWANKMETVEWK